MALTPFMPSSARFHKKPSEDSDSEEGAFPSKGAFALLNIPEKTLPTRDLFLGSFRAMSWVPGSGFWVLDGLEYRTMFPEASVGDARIWPEDVLFIFSILTISLPGELICSASALR